MANNKQLVFGPVNMANAVYTTNLINPAGAPSATGINGYTPTASYILISHLRVVNRTGSAATFRLYLGATGANAAGTEIAYDQSVAANSSWDQFFRGLRLEGASGFLVGAASAANTLTFEAEGEVGFV